MASEEVSPTSAQPKPEALTDTEREALKSKVDPVTGRLLAGSVHHMFIDPGLRTQEPLRDQLKSDILKKTPEDIDYAPANDTLFDKREEAWAHDTRDFAEKNKDWNASFWHDKIEEKTKDGMDNKDEFVEALKSVDIDVTKTDTSADGLHEDLEKFRSTFVPKDRKDFTLQPFISKMAESCTDDGNLNLDKLQQRLKVLHDKGFLEAFGEIDENVDTLVEKYAMAHGLKVLAQKNEAAAETIAEAAAAQTSEYVTDNGQRALLDNVYAKRLKLEQKTQTLPPPQPDTTPEPATTTPPEVIPQPTSTETQPTPPETPTTTAATPEPAPEPETATPVATAEPTPTVEPAAAETQETDAATKAGIKVEQRYALVLPSGQKEGQITEIRGENIKVTLDDGQVIDTTLSRLQDTNWFKKVTEETNKGTANPPQPAPRPQA